MKTIMRSPEEPSKGRLCLPYLLVVIVVLALAYSVCGCRHNPEKNVENGLEKETVRKTKLPVPPSIPDRENELQRCLFGLFSSCYFYWGFSFNRDCPILLFDKRKIDRKPRKLDRKAADWLTYYRNLAERSLGTEYEELGEALAAHEAFLEARDNAYQELAMSPGSPADIQAYLTKLAHLFYEHHMRLKGHNLGKAQHGDATNTYQAKLKLVQALTEKLTADTDKAISSEHVKVIVEKWALPAAQAATDAIQASEWLEPRYNELFADYLAKIEAAWRKSGSHDTPGDRRTFEEACEALTGDLALSLFRERYLVGTELKVQSE